MAFSAASSGIGFPSNHQCSIDSKPTIQCLLSSVVM
jgi:hypothetical protein